MWMQTALTETERAAGPKLHLVRRFLHRGAFVRKLDDGRLLFRGSAWYFWDARKNTVETAPGPALDTRYAEDGSPDARLLAYMVEEGVLLYDFTRKDSVGRYDCAPDERSVCRFSPDGRFLWFAFADRIGVVVLETEEVHVEAACLDGGSVDLVFPHVKSPSALLTISGGSFPTALATFDGTTLSVVHSEREGSVSCFSPHGTECVVENDDGGYHFVEFPAGFAATDAAPPRIESPREFPRGRHHSATYLTDRLLLELSIEVDELYGRASMMGAPSMVLPPRVAIVDRAMCARTAEIRFTRADTAEIVPFGESGTTSGGCAIDSVDSLGGGLILTYDQCCGHRVWDARALCFVDA